MESLPQFLYPNAIPLPPPRFNVALNSEIRASTIWINIENGERGKSLVITPQWSNTFGPDYSLLLVNLPTVRHSHLREALKQNNYFVFRVFVFLSSTWF